MKVNKKWFFFFLASLAAVVVLVQPALSQAASGNIAVIDMQEILVKSKAGQSAQKVLQEKIKELQNSFKKDEDELVTLQKEIEKKSSAWSEEVKQEKAIEFQKKRRDLRMKQDDANLEMKRLREQQLSPIWKVLESAVTDVAKKKGYEIVLPKVSVLYASQGVDITDEVVKALDDGKK